LSPEWDFAMAKEIKAYIQRWQVNNVVKALQKAEVPGISIVEIHPVGCGYEPNYFDPAYESEDILKRYSYLSVVKLEVVCRDEDVNNFVQAIRDAACTKSRGDGRIFVSDVVRAVRIRDGVEGNQAL
jgi:nitrogen regulatory protein P-II 1